MFLEVKDLKKYYSSKEKLIRNLNFSVEQGDIVSFIGESGSGKTTFLKCLAGLEKINSGTIKLNGAVLNDKNSFVALVIFIVEVTEEILFLISLRFAINYSYDELISAPTFSKVAITSSVNFPSFIKSRVFLCFKFISSKNFFSNSLTLSTGTDFNKFFDPK